MQFECYYIDFSVFVKYFSSVFYFIVHNSVVDFSWKCGTIIASFLQEAFGMKNLRTRINRFWFRNRNKGIPNLMLYIALGNALVILLSINNPFLLNLLCFNKTLILQGQVWRLVTYVFTQYYGGFLSLIFIYFFYMLGRHMEQSMGTLKFNAFYLCSIVLMDAFAMIFSPVITEGLYTIEEANYLQDVLGIYQNMAFYLHLSLTLTFATTHPESQFVVFFFIPVKARIMALFYLLIIGIEVYMCSALFPHCLFPLVGLASYFLFFGSQIPNLFPMSWRIKMARLFKKKPPQGPKVITFEVKRGPYAQPAPQKNYTHKCTVCGRTDVTNPELEFRYCSRCNGYHCYCIEHINDHTHVE